jgi:hypothetical protein
MCTYALFNKDVVVLASVVRPGMRSPLFRYSDPDVTLHRNEEYFFFSLRL